MLPQFITPFHVFGCLFSVALAHDPFHTHDFDEQLRSLATGRCGRGHSHGVEFRSRNTCSAPLAINASSSDPSAWAPWTNPPICAGGKYCVFTNSLFRKNQGISIIATKENIADNTGLLDTLFSAPVRQEPNPLPYKVEEIPNKGQGVLATRRIKQYEIVMTDSARILSDLTLQENLQPDLVGQLFRQAVQQLPEPQQVLALAQTIDPLIHASENVMKTNAFGLPFNEINQMALFPKIAVGLPRLHILQSR